MNRERSSQIFHRALELMPGGVNSPARAFGGVGGEPIVIAEAEGDIDEAVRYYQMAGRGGGPAGQAALARAVRLDLPRNPDRYVETRLGQDAAGRLILQVSNPTPLPLRGVKVRVDVQTAQGGTLSYDRNLSQLESGQGRQLLVADDAAAFTGARAVVVEALVDSS